MIKKLGVCMVALALAVTSVFVGGTSTAWAAEGESDWVLESQVPSDAQIVDTKWTYDYLTTMYRTTNSSIAPGVVGYTYVSTNSYFGAYGAWSAWSDSPAYSNEYREVQTQQAVASYNYKTVYHYYRYAYSRDAKDTFSYQASGTTYYQYDVDSELGYYKNYGGGTYKYYYNGVNFYPVLKCGNFTTQEVVSTNYKTQYRYRDRVKYYEHHYKKVEAKESDSEVQENSQISNIQKWVKYVLPENPDPSDDPVNPSDDPVNPSDDPVNPSDDPVNPSDDPVNPGQDEPQTDNRRDIAQTCVVDLEKKTFVYSGLPCDPWIDVWDDEEHEFLKEHKDYTVKINSNQNVGIAKITITGIGEYRGTITKTFTIKPAGTSIVKLKAAKKSMTVYWKKKTTQTTGYQVMYSTSSKFTKKYTKSVRIAKSKTTSKKIAKLTSKKKYYVKIRTYKVNGGKKYYSEWSKVKTVKVK